MTVIHHAHHLHHVTVAARRQLARRPWLYWALVAVIAAACAATVLERVDQVDRARLAWGEGVTVLVATRDIEPGDRLGDAVGERIVPAAVVPDAAAVAEPGGAVGGRARQHVTAGEIITTVDVAADGPLALAPDDWLVVPVVESPGSGAEPGDRVQIVGDGLVISTEAIVIGPIDGATLVAVPADEAPLLPAAAERGLTLLRVP